MADTIYPCNGGIPAYPTYQAAVHRRVQNDERCRFSPTNGSLKGSIIFTISNQHICSYGIIGNYMHPWGHCQPPFLARLRKLCMRGGADGLLAHILH